MAWHMWYLLEKIGGKMYKDIGTALTVYYRDEVEVTSIDRQTHTVYDSFIVGELDSPSITKTAEKWAKSSTTKPPFQILNSFTGLFFATKISYRQSQTVMKMVIISSCGKKLLVDCTVAQLVNLLMPHFTLENGAFSNPFSISKDNGKVIILHPSLSMNVRNTNDKVSITKTKLVEGTMYETSTEKLVYIGKVGNEYKFLDVGRNYSHMSFTFNRTIIELEPLRFGSLDLCIGDKVYTTNDSNIMLSIIDIVTSSKYYKPVTKNIYYYSVKDEWRVNLVTKRSINLKCLSTTPDYFGDQLDKMVEVAQNPPVKFTSPSHYRMQQSNNYRIQLSDEFYEPLKDILKDMEVSDAAD